MSLKFILIIILSVLPQIAFSQIFKCKNSNGKVIYSEESCPKGTIGSEIYLESNTIDSSALRKNINAQKTTSNITPSQNTTSTNSASSDNLMSEHDKQNRLWALLLDMKNGSAYYEKQADAKNEHACLLNKTVYNLSYENELNRSNLKIDLGSINSSTRSIALQQLSAIYFKYQYP